MNGDEALLYVRAAATALGLTLAPERDLAVALHLGRTAALARLLAQVDLAPHDEPAELFLPAPFPREDA
jgi:hypothetical protein